MLRWLVATTLLVSATAWVSSLPISSVASRRTRISRGEALWAGVKKPKKVPAAGGFGSKPVVEKEVSLKHTLHSHPNCLLFLCVIPSLGWSYVAI